MAPSPKAVARKAAAVANNYSNPGDGETLSNVSFHTVSGVVYCTFEHPNGLTIADRPAEQSDKTRFPVEFKASGLSY